ncbi:radical SAM protein [Rhodobacteraceae bacterium RKSG542]|uniref:B12-binding domain-containing radical SAM protein n=1 Tax=Pseudovibrio flavus TaxID=2529854 RepID=UPI0012BB8751|nr:radical SAM protein [Pseudovibrio flavus]MTI16119.1 radical SAM protein [Pseudovibrio flavus]
MIKPTHYDDEGYPIQWLRSAIPSNTLACLYGLAQDCQERRILGEATDIMLHSYDETNRRVRPEKIAKMIRKEGGTALIALVGVQSNQYPRAMDIALKFRKLGFQVCIGGFHVSGCISMLPELPQELVEAQQQGISLFAGEAEEGRLDEVLEDGFYGTLKPLYNFMNDLPQMQNQPDPILPQKHIMRTAGSHSSFDLGRGCPYQCSFCTIINVQGRKSRSRSADDVERIIRRNLEQGINRFFITDDNFARNKDWELLFDRLIELREGEGLDIKFIIQVDTLCHRIPRFIEKACRAGVNRVFIGLENINPDNLIAAKKRQNRITEYREMLQEWREHGATTYAGYILGFPGDTRETILRDIEIIKKELPLDLLEFFYLTPLPGSEDHQKLHANKTWMDPDLNKYDLNHRVSHHGKMSDQEWESVYMEAWKTYYSPEHITTVLKRAAAHKRGRPGNKLFLMMWFYLMVTMEGVHPLEGGYFRVKSRRERRRGLPLESPWVFYPRYWVETAYKQLRLLTETWRFYRVYQAVRRDPDKRSYMDLALSPVVEGEEEELRLFNDTAGGTAAVSKQKKAAALRDRIAAAQTV